MRDHVPLLTLALAVVLLAVPAASAGLSITDTTDTIDRELDATQSTIDELVPGPITAAQASALDQSLPGDDRPLQLADHRLADTPVSQVTTTASTTLDSPTASADGTATVDGPDDTQVYEIGPVQDRATLDDLPDYVTGDSAPTSDEGQEQATTQSQAQSSADASSSLEEAWNSMDDGEKAAAAAGALGLLAIGPLTLYSRIKRDDALENDTRREVYEIVEANPGVCIQDIADEAEVSYSTASYHLKRLVRMDYVTRREDGNKVLYYKNGGTFSEEERELIPVVQNDEAMRVFRHIVENPWCYRAQVADALDVSHTTVNWHLDNLQEADLVEEHREGRSCHLHVDEDALDRVSRILDKLETPETTETAPKAKAAAA